MTVSDIIQDALTTIGELQPQQTPSPEDLAYGMQTLNAILDSWSTERLNLYTVNSAQYSLTPGKQDYTVGPTGDFSQNRPVLVQNISVIL